ncbi:MAG: hypothetical protein GY696_26515 [Gammaproteobacteria bacterium]|nr:hypothetical protein [Gammaproteobacteria bacterium]
MNKPERIKPDDCSLSGREGSQRRNTVGTIGTLSSVRSAWSGPWLVKEKGFYDAGIPPPERESN